MKKTNYFILFITVAACIGLSINSLAGPIGSSNDNIDYLIGAADLSKAYIGLHVKEVDRTVGMINDDRDFKYRGQKSSVYAGYYFARWCSLYLTLADSEVEIPGISQDSGMEYGFGLYFDILDHDIKDPNLMEDKVRINAGIEYTVLNDVEAFYDEDAKIEEYSASLTFSIVNDLHRNILFTPNSIGLFAGPVYSYLDSTTLEARDTLGYMYGLDIYFTQEVYVSFGMYDVGKQEIMAGLHLRL